MTDIDSMIAVLQAYKDGKVIQVSVDGTHWTDAEAPYWDFYHNDYRVKPAPQKTWLYVSGGSPLVQLATYASDANLELEFIDGKLVGAKVL